ncbi:Uncharacterised protein [Vibrio cholerae]|nr:Uncharacterised protein [Vibrio cholerae]CSI87404.1 Uncharacterised protein [Vibrio cholerae]
MFLKSNRLFNGFNLSGIILTIQQTLCVVELP